MVICWRNQGMKMRFFYSMLGLSCILLIAGAGLRLSYEDRSNKPLSCISSHTFVHDDFSMNARYFFSFYQKEGVVRIYGKIHRDGRDYPIGRQIFFSFTKTGDEYTLKSSQIEKMSQDQGKFADEGKHFPSFFLQKDRNFSFIIHRDRFNNPVLIYAGVPVFHCLRRDKPI